MTPEEMGLEAFKKSVEVVLSPYTEIVRSVLGEAAMQVGLSFGEQVALWRSKRRAKFEEDFCKFVSDRGFALKPVAPRLLLPICDNAAMEDDEDLYGRWLALLANAAVTDFETEVLPPFPDILRQLTSEEAKFLDRIHAEVSEDEENAAVLTKDAYKTVKELRPLTLPIRAKTLESVSMILIQNLERLMLVSRISGVSLMKITDPVSHMYSPANHLYVTDFGTAFVRACNLPAK
jgi:hypothetical protein